MPHYTLTPTSPEAHLFTTTVTVQQPDTNGQVFRLPVWIPGSYMVREFARNIIRISAQCKGKSVALTQLDKHTWQAAPCKGALTVTTEIYAWDLSVRAAHLDTTHAFFNGTSVFLQVEGQADAPCTLDLQAPSGKAYKAWRVATSLPEAQGKGGAKRYGFGLYAAENYDALVDHPVEMGSFALGTFTACGVPHDVVFTGHVPNLDMPRLLADLQPICEAQIKLFEPKTQQAPMQRYVFMTMVTTDGYGGLEHRASTALMCGRNDLPVVGRAEQSEGYRTFLGLCSHEYFHTWNVKRIKPAAFAPYNYSQENYTRLLWLFEGFTSYYDDLVLVRTGRITTDAYLKLLEKNLNTVLQGNGRNKQSVAASSFDAWTKYYRQDENAPNAIVSYYGKGALIALGLDAKIRITSQGKRSLDDVMRLLWRRYGRGITTGVPENGMPDLIVEALEKYATADFSKWLNHYFRTCIEGTQDVPLSQLLAPLGVALTAQSTEKSAPPNLGIKTTNDGGWLKVTQVLDGGAAQAAGLAQGDYIASLDGVRVKPSGANSLEKVLSRHAIGQSVPVQIYRRDVLMELTLMMQVDGTQKMTLKLAEKKTALRKAWLGE